MTTEQVKQGLEQLPPMEAEAIAKEVLLKDRDLVLITEAADLLNVDRQKLAVAVSNGKLPAKKLYRLYHVSLQVTSLFLQGSKNGVSPKDVKMLWEKLHG